MLEIKSQRPKHGDDDDDDVDDAKDQYRVTAKAQQICSRNSLSKKSPREDMILLTKKKTPREDMILLTKKTIRFC